MPGRPLHSPSLTRRLSVEPLEPRCLLAATASLLGGVLTVTGTPGRDNVHVSLDAAAGQLVVRSFADVIGRFASAAVASIAISTGAGDDIVRIDNAVTQPAVIDGGTGRDILTGGGGPTTLLGGAGPDKLTAGTGQTTLNGDGGANLLFGVKPIDTAIVGPMDRVFFALPAVPHPVVVPAILTAGQVNQLLDRASAATASNDAIIAIVDRGGRLLGVRVEGGVDPAITGNPNNLVFAVDGALAEARTAAFFANDQAPLTSRTIQDLSQTTMTQREIDSNPSITDINSTLRGPGFVAPIGLKDHFPAGVQHTPQVDLFAIEHTNRDKSTTPFGTRFNVNPAFIPASIPINQRLAAPDSYGLLSGLEPGAQSRGIGTLPGGIPIYENGQLVGGIGVFFPGKTGFASEENSSLNINYNPTKPDRSLEAEYIAFAAVGGLPTLGQGVGTIAGIPPVAGVGLPPVKTPGDARIDLVGITLDLFGPQGRLGADRLIKYGRAIGEGPVSGALLPINTANATLMNSTPVPEGFLVTPHDGVGITAAEVQKIIQDGIDTANTTRAAIRLPFNSPVKMVFAVADLNGEIVGLFRMHDATVFSIDVAVAKARNVAYYNSLRLQPIDRLPGVPLGTALTNRSFRFVSLPRFPEGVDGAPPGPFSILNDGGIDPATGLNVGPPLPASAYQSVQGFDAFNPGTNFHDTANPANRNGIVFFPGSSGVYRNGALVGGFGVSGDGVDQDDVVTAGGATGFEPPANIRIDQTFVRGIRVPYQKYNRNPQGGIVL